MQNSITNSTSLLGVLLIQVNGTIAATGLGSTAATEGWLISSTAETTTTTTVATATVFEELLSHSLNLPLVRSTAAPQALKGLREYSPVTLSPKWSRLSRLLLLSALCILGSVGNVFMISSVVIEDYLKRPGNAFIVNIALADLLLTSVSIPASTILLLAGIDTSQTVVCRIQWFLTACVFIVTVLSIVATAIENYVRLCVVREDDDSKHNWFNKANTTGTLIFIWLIGLVLSGSQFLHQVADGDQDGIAAGGGEVGAPLPFEYCRRKNKELLPSGVIILTVTLIVPLVATFFIYLRMHMTMQRFVRQTNFKPNYWFSSDFALAKTNFYSFVIFILFWAPFAIVACLATSRPITNQSFYNCAWVGMSKSCFYNIIYCLTHRHFRNAYMNLFNYCCCKTSFVATSRRHRNDGNSSGGGGGGVPGTSSRPDVRVHIIPGYNMYSYTSPQRRDVHEL